MTRGGLTIGLDIGTGSAKATVLDPGRQIVARAASTYDVARPGPDQAEQDPLDWWTGAVSAVRTALSATPRAPISAIAVSGQGAALVLLDRDGEPVARSMIHLDQRAALSARRLSDSPVGVAVAAANGNRIGAWNVAAKLSWIRDNQPEVFASTTCITSASGFLLSRLVGYAVQSVSDAGISDLFELAGRCWSVAVLEALDLSPRLLPCIADSTSDVGALSAAAADQLGLSTSVRVVAGGEDTPAAALAAGVLDRGDGFVSLGTAAVAGVAVDHAMSHEPRLLTYPHVRSGLDLLSGSMTSAGSAIGWLASITAAPPEVLLAEAEHAPVGAAGVTFLPYLAGELHPIADPAARGVFAGLSLSSTRGHLARAVVEASAGAIAHNLVVAAQAGAAPARLFATGRPSRSRAWMQSIADATGLPTEVIADDGAPLGDAILAAAEANAGVAELVHLHRQVKTAYYSCTDAHAAAVRRRELAAQLYNATRPPRE